MIASIIGALRGDVRLVRKAGKVLDVIELTPEEQNEVNFRYDERAQFAEWERHDHKWDVTFNDPELLVLVKETLRGKNDWPAAQHRQVSALYEALGVE